MTLYFDHAAATPMAPEVLESMLPFFSTVYGNPSSIHAVGQRARRAIDESREIVASILNCKPQEVLFTSSGTESNNFFLFGLPRGHIVTTTIEHESVLKPLAFLEKQGFEVTRVPVDADGLVNPEDIAKAVRADTIAISVMYANNEIGTVQDIGAIKRPGGVRFHTDACQASPYLSLDVKKLGVDLLTFNGSKMYGPKGAGVLYVKEGIELTPLLFGGGQEYRKRSGTENVAAIVGLATALQLAQKNREAETIRLTPLRDALIHGILSTIPKSRLNGHPTKRLPNNVNVSFSGLEGEAILMRLDMLNISASSGSACTSGSLEPSHVAQALGLTTEWTHSATRFTLGRETTQADIDFVLAELPKIITELRETSPF